MKKTTKTALMYAGGAAAVLGLVYLATIKKSAGTPAMLPGGKITAATNAAAQQAGLDQGGAGLTFWIGDQHYRSTGTFGPDGRAPAVNLATGQTIMVDPGTTAIRYD